MMVVGGERLHGLYFETWSRLSRRGVVSYCSLVVWHAGSFGGLVERPNHISMLCCIFPTLWMDF
jgi:hypothetical protein